MVTGQLEQAFKLAEKHMLEVQTILDLKRIIAKEVNSSPRMEEKILQSMIQLLENNKTILQEAQ
ncbi:MAG: ABC transporter permease [Lysinibacillus sp.]